MKTDSTNLKSIHGEFRWIYWDDKSEFPQIGDGFNYSFYLIFMLTSIIHLHQVQLKGLSFDYVFTICCIVVFSVTWALLTFVRLRYLRRSRFWAFLILPQPLFFYQIHSRKGLFVVFIILATTLILYLAKPRLSSASRTSSEEQPPA